MGGDGGTAAVDIFVEDIEDVTGFLQTLGINIIKGKVRIFEGFTAHAVAKHVSDKDSASGTHKCDFRHDTIPLYAKLNQIFYNIHPQSRFFKAKAKISLSKWQKSLHTRSEARNAPGFTVAGTSFFCKNP